MSKFLDGVEYFECVCHSSDHTFRFIRDDDPDTPAIYLEVQLHHGFPWHRRVWRAIKYIFGYECRYGHWDVTELDVDEAERLGRMMAAFVATHRPLQQECSPEEHVS